MPSLKLIRKRIGSVRNTQKITRALKMVATARLRRAQDQIQAFRPYAKKLREVAFDLISEETKEKTEVTKKADQTPNTMAPFFEERPEQNIRLVLITLDRGLSGAFNSNIFRRTEQFLVEKEPAVVEFSILGRKGMEYVKRRLREQNNPGQFSLAWQTCQILLTEPAVEAKTVMARSHELAKRLTADFLEKKTDAVYLIFNEFHSIARQTVQVHKLLPLSLASFSQANSVVKPAEVFPGFPIDPFLYEPNPQELAQKLLPLYVEIEIQRMFLESIASQFGAQMSAMDNASRNAKEMITDLTQQMNRARQAAITKELMEIIGGAEALKG